MAQYKSYNPNAQVIGRSILPMIMGMGDRAKPYLERYGLANVEPDEWYSQQDFLSACRDVANGEGGTMDFVSIGMNIPAMVNFPPEIDSVRTILLSFNDAYHMNQRNDESGWEVTEVGPGHFVCVSSNPFPHDFDYGVIYGFVRRFRKPGERFTVEIDPTAPSRANGDDTSTYIVKLG